MPALVAVDDDVGPSLVFLQRHEAIEHLRACVARCERERGVSFRRAMKLVAPEVGLTNMAVRRLIDDDPDN